MYSFPNYIPLSAAMVQRVDRAVESFEFRRIYGMWWDAVIADDGKDCIRRSAERCVATIKESTNHRKRQSGFRTGARNRIGPPPMLRSPCGLSRHYDNFKRFVI